MHGHLTKKADIYSFGVLVLEIVSGRSISDVPGLEMEKFLLAWVSCSCSCLTTFHLLERTYKSYVSHVVIFTINILVIDNDYNN